MTPDPRLAALRALAEKATPGEWILGAYHGSCRISDPGHHHGEGKCDYRISLHYSDKTHVVSVRAAIGDPYPAAHGEPGSGILGNYDYDCGGAITEADAAFIAAANPAVVLSLLAALAAAEGRLAAVCEDNNRCHALLQTPHWIAHAERDALTTERDALATRLAGAERVVAAARELMEGHRLVHIDGYHKTAEALSEYDYPAYNDRVTHRCKVCGALWWKGYVHPVGESWSLRSKTCGKCCDNVAMGDQIEPLPSEAGGEGRGT